MKFRNKKKKVILHILLAIGGLLVGLVSLNLLLTGRLERYLKTELIQRTADATNGFYRLSFEKLAVSFFNGELKIEGVRLIPDSAVFHRWQALDSLPRTYIETQIDLIEFKGINLTWRWSFKRLHFNAFNIQSPRIRIFDTHSANRPEQEDKRIDAKTLYQLISPYINQLSVRALHLRDASVSYTVPTASTPIVYGLQNVSFQAYGFLLDSTSSMRGKLLYCDQFNFVTHQPQVLLTNNDFRLQTDSIRLSTEDSAIYIRNILLTPQEEIWSEQRQKPDKYVTGSIESVNVNGVRFDRKEGLNYLHAHSFEIHTSAIQAFNLSAYKTMTRNTANSHTAERDSLIQSLSLYELMSPVLRQITIHQIGIEKTKLNYSVAVNDSLELYKVDDLNVYTHDFRIDSASAFSHDIGYSTSFSVEATGIQGLLTARQQMLNMARLVFDSEKRHFQITDLRFMAYERDRVGMPQKSVDLSIPSLRMEGLDYLLQPPSLTLKAAVFVMDSACIDIQSRKHPEEDIHATVRCLSLDSLAWTIKDWKQILTPRPSPYAAPKPTLYESLARYAERISLGKLHLTDAQATYTLRGTDSLFLKQHMDTTDLFLEGLSIYPAKRLFSLHGFRLHTCNLNIPFDHGFYTLRVGSLSLTERELRLDRIRLVSPYSKMAFAYRQPKHQDWFDVAVESVQLDGIDLFSYFSSQVLTINKVQINNSVLQNFKNKQIDVQPRWMPMIYESLQKAPIRLSIDTLDIRNLSVVYEELAKNGTSPGKLFFTDLNGHFTGFTNVVSYPEQYIRLDANGKLMGEGGFTATWLLPVDSLNDRFMLRAQLYPFDLTRLNDIITPLVPAKVETGWLDDLTFHIEASSQGGTTDMCFLYHQMRAVVLKEKEGVRSENEFISRLANLLLKKDNPELSDKGDKTPRRVRVYTERNPYHSTFNYLWQLLRPAVARSVGISGHEEELARKAEKILSRIKSLLRRGKNKEKEWEGKTVYPSE